MKTITPSSTIVRRLSATFTAAILCSSVMLHQPLFAAGGSKSVTPIDDKAGTVKSGGGAGGGKSSTTPTTPATPTTPLPPTQPIYTATLAFTAAASVNGYVPQCTGSYRMDPYYPTLSLLTVTVQPSSVNVPDGTPLYVTVNVAGGVGYPFTSNIITVTAQSGSCTLSEYVTPGTTVTSVVISDASGTVVCAGN